MQPQLVVFTDLDGTLLDHHTFGMTKCTVGLTRWGWGSR